MKMIGINPSPASAVQEPRPAAAGGWPARPRDRIAEVCRPWGLREIGPCHRGEACWCSFPDRWGWSALHHAAGRAQV